MTDFKKPKGGFILSNPKEKLSLIHFFLKYKGKRYVASTGEKIIPKHWNEKMKQPKLNSSEQSILNKKKEYEVLNERLNTFKETFRTSFHNYCLEHNKVPENAAVIVNKILIEKAAQQNKKKKISLIDFIDTYTENLSEETQKGTINKYKRLKADLLAFQGETEFAIDYETINLDFKNKFTKWLNKERKKETGKPYSTSTIKERFKLIKALMNESKNNNYHTNNYHNAKAFKVKALENEEIALKEREVMALYNLDLSHDKNKEAVRDLFILQCYTALRFSDAYRLKPDNIKKKENGTYSIWLTIGKTQKLATLPIINDEVIEILKKYNFYAPPIQGKSKGSKNVMANRLLKEICSAVPALQEEKTLKRYEGKKEISVTKARWHFVSTHCGRRTFATNEYFKGTDLSVIRMMTKHSSDKMLLKYIKKTSEHDAELFRAYKAKQKQEKATIIKLSQAI